MEFGEGPLTWPAPAQGSFWLALCHRGVGLCGPVGTWTPLSGSGGVSFVAQDWASPSFRPVASMHSSVVGGFWLSEGLRSLTSAAADAVPLWGAGNTALHVSETTRLVSGVAVLLRPHGSPTCSCHRCDFGWSPAVWVGVSLQRQPARPWGGCPCARGPRVRLPCGGRCSPRARACPRPSWLLAPGFRGRGPQPRERPTGGLGAAFALLDGLFEVF